MEEMIMNKACNKKIYLSILLFSALVPPYSAFASTVYLETAQRDFLAGDTILVDVKVDSEGAEINAVEGNISLDSPSGAALVRDISVSGSSFSLWPNRPLLSEDLQTISFAGGVPNGLKQEGATVFKIVLTLKSAGQITLNPASISVYLNDGKGTRDV